MRGRRDDGLNVIEVTESGTTFAEAAAKALEKAASLAPDLSRDQDELRGNVVKAVVSMPRRPPARQAAGEIPSSDEGEGGSADVEAHQHVGVKFQVTITFPEH